MKFLVPNYSCLQIRGLPPPNPRSLCPLSSTEFVEPPPEQNSWVRHWFHHLFIWQYLFFTYVISHGLKSISLHSDFLFETDSAFLIAVQSSSMSASFSM